LGVILKEAVRAQTIASACVILVGVALMINDLSSAGFFLTSELTVFDMLQYVFLKAGRKRRYKSS
jgi:drug/metabolite transporter (DMT)-like permease